MMHFVPVAFGHCWHGEGVSYHMRRHDHLKTVYMSGFRCYRAQVELLCGILEMGAVLEHVTIEPMVRIPCSPGSVNLGIPQGEICEWAHRTQNGLAKRSLSQNALGSSAGSHMHPCTDFRSSRIKGVLCLLCLENFYVAVLFICYLKHEHFKRYTLYGISQMVRNKCKLFSHFQDPSQRPNKKVICVSCIICSIVWQKYDNLMLQVRLWNNQMLMPQLCYLKE